MKKKITNKKATKELISRKEAIKKTGIAALTATSIIFLETQKSSASSFSPTKPGR